jgi:hypothetical protein
MHGALPAGLTVAMCDRGGGISEYAMKFNKNKSLSSIDMPS